MGAIGITSGGMDNYGYNWPSGVNQLTIELWCYAHRSCSVDEKWVHFKIIVNLAFNVLIRG